MPPHDKRDDCSHFQERVEKFLFQGNGVPPITVQIADLKSDLSFIKKALYIILAGVLVPLIVWGGQIALKGISKAVMLPESTANAAQ